MFARIKEKAVKIVNDWIEAMESLDQEEQDRVMNLLTNGNGLI